MPTGKTQWALYSGDVLLSHGLSPYYHRGCSVSLPCSEWERVGPLRYCHQKFGSRWRDKFLARDSRFETRDSARGTLAFSAELRCTI